MNFSQGRKAGRILARSSILHTHTPHTAQWPQKTFGSDTFYCRSSHLKTDPGPNKRPKYDMAAEVLGPDNDRARAQIELLMNNKNAQACQQNDEFMPFVRSARGTVELYARRKTLSRRIISPFRAADSGVNQARGAFKINMLLIRCSGAGLVILKIGGLSSEAVGSR